MNITFQDFDRLQNNLRQATDDILRLTARVEALEAGAPLPADQKITCESYIASQHVVTPEITVKTDLDVAAPIVNAEPAPLPDISAGWVGAGRRG